MASGPAFDPETMVVAHRSLRFGTVLEVKYKNRSIIVTVRDRGPYVKNQRGEYTRDLDLSERAARELGTLNVGVAHVEFQRIN